MSEKERIKRGLVKPKPGDRHACWMCHGSGEGDDEGRCSRCCGYGCEPRIVRYEKHWRFGYGGLPGDDPIELGDKQDYE
jgi:hypothetical protein